MALHSLHAISDNVDYLQLAQTFPRPQADKASKNQHHTKTSGIFSD